MQRLIFTVLAISSIGLASRFALAATSDAELKCLDEAVAAASKSETGLQVSDKINQLIWELDFATLHNQPKDDIVPDAQTRQDCTNLATTFMSALSSYSCEGGHNAFNAVGKIVMESHKEELEKFAEGHPLASDIIDAVMVCAKYDEEILDQLDNLIDED